MSIRKITIDDLPKVIDYVVEKTWQDGFHKWFFPRKYEHPFAYRRWWTQYVRGHILRPNLYSYVFEEESTGKILGWVSMAPGENNDAPVDLDLSKNSRRERWLRKYWAHHDALREKIRPNPCADKARLEYFFKVVSPGMKKTIFVGEDSRNWVVAELILDPAMQPEDARDICIKLLDHAKEQCHKDDVGLWVLTSGELIDELKEYGFEWRHKLEIGNVSADAMKLVEN